jgi:hypothetical protein
VVNLEAMEVEEAPIFVGGKPSLLAVFGVMGEDHHAHDHVHAHIPEANCVLIAYHNMLAYFARDYGFKLLSVLGLATTEIADPSARQIAAFVDRIREIGVPAIFAENISNPRLVEQIANRRASLLPCSTPMRLARHTRRYLSEHDAPQY